MAEGNCLDILTVLELKWIEELEGYFNPKFGEHLIIVVDDNNISFKGRIQVADDKGDNLMEYFFYSRWQLKDKLEQVLKEYRILQRQANREEGIIKVVPRVIPSYLTLVED